MKKSLRVIALSLLLPIGVISAWAHKTATIPVVVESVYGIFANECGELSISNLTIDPEGPFCPGDMVQFSVTGFNLPEGEFVQFYLGNNIDFNPLMERGK